MMQAGGGGTTDWDNERLPPERRMCRDRIQLGVNEGSSSAGLP